MTSERARTNTTLDFGLLGTVDCAVFYEDNVIAGVVIQGLVLSPQRQSELLKALNTDKATTKTASAHRPADSEILAWIENNVDHLEHGGRQMPDGYWPQNKDDYNLASDEYIGMSLRQYVEARMKEQQ